MSDYDAAFKAASEGKPSDSPYDDVMSQVMAQTKAVSPVTAPTAADKAVVETGRTLNSVPRELLRQLGLTARYGIEGLANAAQIVTEPTRYLTDRLTGSTGTTVPLGTLATQLADRIGLPQPQGALERVIGDASRLGFGAGGMGAAAGAARNLPGMAGEAAKVLSSNMPQQLSSAAGAGLAGGASREGGGDAFQQGALSLIGGVAGGIAPGVAGSVIDTARRLVKPLSPADLDQQISVILNRANVDYSQLPGAAKSALRKDLADALKTGSDLDPQAVARLADFRTVGATPTRGMLTLDPVQVTREQNLAKMAANTADAELHGLPRLQNQNNATLIRNLNEAGAAKGDIGRAGQAAVDAIAARDAAMKQRVSGLYSAAREMPGGTTPLDRTAVVNSIYDALAKQNKMAYLPEDIGNTLNTISQGQVTRGGRTFDVPFDANALDNLLTDIATAQRSTQDGNVKAALNIARKAIDATALKPVKRDFGGNQLVTEAGAKYLLNKDAEAGEFMNALNQARAAAAQRFGWQESARPIDAALRSGLQEVDPAKFVQQYVIGGSLKDAKAVAQNAPVEEVKNAIVAHLKEKALTGAADEVGKFSQSAYNKAMNQIGFGKLSLFFSPEEIANLKAAGRVASYMQHQPTGSAVNNSNSGALLAGKAYDALNWAAQKLPFGETAITQPLKNIEISLRNRQAQNITPALLAPAAESAPVGSSLLLPAIAAGGTLAAP